MKKRIFTLSILLLALVLAACGGQAGSDVEAVGQTAGESNASVRRATYDSALTTTYENALPATSQLVVGTVKLDGTAEEVTPEQAKTMLTLWKAARSLGESETAAPEEIAAVFRQIEGTLTSEQIKAISAMELTFEDMAAAAEAMGFEIGGGGGRFGDITPEQRATFEAARESGEFPAPPNGFGGPGGGFGGQGGGPGGGGPGGGFGGLTPEQRETAIAERGGARGAGTGVNSLLLDMIIGYLEGKVQ